MIHTKATPCIKAAFWIVAVLAATLLVSVGARSTGAVEAQGQGKGLAGTWFVSLPGGLTGFYTYQQDGTMTGAVSTMFGAQPQPPGPLNTASPDHGVWRQVGGGFEVAIYRFVYSSVTGDPVGIIRVRSFITFTPDRDTTFGTFVGDQWVCPDALSCPDPNTTPPDLEGFAPPPPLNTWTQTRVRLP